MKRRGEGFSDPEGSVGFSVSSACRLEIEAAIDLLVIDENLIAAHLLASAAHDVMRGHARRVGAAPRLDMASILRPLFPGHEKAFADYLLRPYNAMKHSLDSDVAVTVHPSWVEATVFLATQQFGSLFDHLSGKMVLFIAWFTAVHPTLRQDNGGQVLLDRFPAASGTGPRSQQMTDPRKLLVQLIVEGTRFADVPAGRPVGNSEPN